MADASDRPKGQDLAVADDFSQERIDIVADHGIGGAFGDECLNAHRFTLLAPARELITGGLGDYNGIRPDSLCRRISPARFAINHRAWRAGKFTGTAGGAGQMCNHERPNMTHGCVTPVVKLTMAAQFHQWRALKPAKSTNRT